jgi:Flp pilus assembly protein TadD
MGARGVLVPAEAFAAAIHAANEAIQLNPALPEAHASLGFALWARDRDFETAEHHLHLAIALNPEYALAHDWLGLMNSARRRPEAAVAYIERARRLDPHSPLYAADLALCQYVARRYDLAIDSFQPPADSTFPVNGSVFALSLLAKGEAARANETARQFVQASNRNPLALGVWSVAAGAAGNSALTRSLLQELNARGRDYYVSGVALALANLAAGRLGDALNHLERACRERDWWTEWLSLMPVWDELRDDPRFMRLIQDQKSPDGTLRQPGRGLRRAWASAAAAGRRGVVACRTRLAEFFQLV